MTKEELKRMLAELEDFERRSKEEQAELLTDIIYHLIKRGGIEIFVEIFRDELLRNPALIDAVIMFWRGKLLEELQKEQKETMEE